MLGRRLCFARDDNRFARIGFEVCNGSFDPCAGFFVQCGGSNAGNTHTSSNGIGQGRNLGCPDGETMIGHGARVAWCWFGCVEPVHFRFGCGDATLVGEVTAIADRCCTAVGEVAVERNHDVCLVEGIHDVGCSTEGLGCTIYSVITTDGVILHPFGACIRACQRCDCGAEAR